MSTRETGFAEYVFSRKEKDSGFRACLKQASSDSLEWKSWAIIQRFVTDLSNESERKAFVLIGSSIAKSHAVRNGNVGLGKAFAIASRKAGYNDEFPPRFMRVLSCTSVSELIDVLRPSLSFLDSKMIPLDYGEILSDILRFRYGEEAIINVKARWTADFLSKEDTDVSE